MSLLDAAAINLTLRQGGRDVTGEVPHRRLFDVTTFSTYLVYWGEASAEPLELSLLLPIEGVPGIDDLLAGTHVAATGYARDPASNRVRLLAPLTGRPMLVNFNEGATGVLTDQTSVSAERQLSIGEIISRHQQQQAAQDALVRSYIASRAHAAVLPADADRSGLRRGHGEPLLRRRRQRRMGGAVVFGQRLDLDQ